MSTTGPYQVGVGVDTGSRRKTATRPGDRIFSGLSTGAGVAILTVLAGVANTAEILRTEIFGPVAPITTFITEEQAIAMANSTEYGLAAYLYSRDFNRLLRVSERIEFGMVGFNAGVISNAAAPFGGVKQSGLGREGGSEGIAEYTTTQYIGIADPYA